MAEGRQALSKGQMLLLKNCGAVVRELAVKDGVQKGLFDFLWSRTIGYGKFETEMDTRCFFDGDKFSLIGCCDLYGVSEETVSRAKTDLHKRGIFTFTHRIGKKCSKHRTKVRVNLPAILKFLRLTVAEFYGQTSEKYRRLEQMES